MFSLKRSISKFWRSLHSLQVFWDALPVCTLEVVLVEPANWENYSLRCHRLSRVGSGTTAGPVTNAVHAPTDGDSWSCRHEVYQTNGILMLFLCQNQLNYRIAKEHIDTKTDMLPFIETAYLLDVTPTRVCPAKKLEEWTKIKGEQSLAQPSFFISAALHRSFADWAQLRAKHLNQKRLPGRETAPDTDTVPRILSCDFHHSSSRVRGVLPHRRRERQRPCVMHWLQPPVPCPPAPLLGKR